MPSESNGVKLGEARLHPYVQVDTRFVVNPGRLSDNGPKDVVLVARPGLDLLLPSEKLDLKLNSDVEWRQYLGVDDEETRDLSTLLGQANIAAAFNQHGTVRVNLREKFVRSADPGNETVSARLLHITNDVGVGLDIRPGGGALIIAPSYGFMLIRYDRTNNAVEDPQQLDNMRHVPRLRVSWKFLPKTSIFLEVEGQLSRFYSSDFNADSNIVLAYLGAVGSVTRKIGLLLRAGYGNTLISERDLQGDSNFSSFVGQAEFNFLASETTRLRVGVLRTVQSTSLFKYFDMIRSYAGYQQAFGRAQLEVGISYDYLLYGRSVQPPTDIDRVDGNIVGNIALHYQINEWLTISMLDRLDQRTSNFENPTSGAETGDYFTNDVFIRASARY